MLSGTSGWLCRDDTEQYLDRAAKSRSVKIELLRAPILEHSVDMLQFDDLLLPWMLQDTQYLCYKNALLFPKEGLQCAVILLNR